MRQVALHPSQFAFLLDECPRCWWMKTRGVRMPGPDLPNIFKSIDKGMKERFNVETLRSIGIPAKLLLSRSFVKSKPAVYAGVELRVLGYMDRAVLLDSDTIGIIDYKTSTPSAANTLKYARQLNAYAYAVENAAERAPQEVSDLWLVSFDATGEFKVKERSCAQTGLVSVDPIPLDRVAFQQTLDECAALAGRDLPDSNPTCERCLYLTDASKYLEEHRRLAAKKRVAA